MCQWIHLISLEFSCIPTIAPPPDSSSESTVFVVEVLVYQRHGRKGTAMVWSDYGDKEKRGEERSGYDGKGLGDKRSSYTRTIAINFYLGRRITGIQWKLVNEEGTRRAKWWEEWRMKRFPVWLWSVNRKRSNLHEESRQTHEHG